MTKHTEVIRLPRAFLEPNSTDVRLGALGASEQPPHMVGGAKYPQDSFLPGPHCGPWPRPARKEPENIWREVLQRGPDTWVGVAGPEGNGHPAPGWSAGISLEGKSKGGG